MKLLIAQTPASAAISFAKQPPGVTSFTKHWAYPYYVIRHNDGSFENTEGGGIKAADTAHLYFTANCTTNVQGGYTVRYSAASKKEGNIILNFADGLPAYGSEYNVIISNKGFYFKPEIVYEEKIKGEKINYVVTKQKLTLYQKDVFTAKAISGYVDAEFMETTTPEKGKPVIRKYYFRGYFKTAVNK
jgi:hypothetical protein